MSKLTAILQKSTLKEHEKEQLEFLGNTASFRMELFHKELENMFLNPRAVGKVQIIGERPVRYYEDYRVDTTEGDSKTIAEEVIAFTRGSTDATKSGFQSLIEHSLKSILSNTTPGKQEAKASYIVIEHDTLMRVDARFWKHNFSQKGVIGNHKNAFCYLFAKSVIAPKKITLDDLTSLVAEEASGPNVKNLIAEVQDVWQKAQSFDEDTIHLEYLKRCRVPE